MSRNPASPMSTLRPHSGLARQCGSSHTVYEGSSVGICGSHKQNNTITLVDAGTDCNSSPNNNLEALRSQISHIRRFEQYGGPPSFLRRPILQTTPTTCPVPPGNDLRQAAVHNPSQVLVRCLIVTPALSNWLTFHSQETAVRRCRQDATGYCKGIVGCISTAQVVSGRYQRIDQALRCASPSNNRSVPPANVT